MLTKSWDQKLRPGQKTGDNHRKSVIESTTSMPIASFYSQPCFNAFFDPIFFTTKRTTISPIVTMKTRIRLKASGSRSNPLDGDVLVKKISGPPNAITKDWDSRDV